MSPLANKAPHKPAAKLDLNAAWDHAVRLMSVNREVILVLAGVFFLLPYALFLLLVPIPDFSAIAAATGNNSQAMAAAVNGFLAEYWWAILLLMLAQTIGGLAVMAVVGDPARPTVREAMTRGAAYLPTNFATQVLTSLATTAVMILALLIGAVTGSQAVATALALLVLPVVIWMMTRWSVSGATIAIEKTVNPVAALRRSWRLTKGNSLRLVAFYVLLFAAYFVISQVLGLLIRVATALPGADVAEILGALLSALIYAVMIAMGYAVLASVHRQLARAERVSVPGTAERF